MNGRLRGITTTTKKQIQDCRVNRIKIFLQNKGQFLTESMLRISDLKILLD